MLGILVALGINSMLAEGLGFGRVMQLGTFSDEADGSTTFGNLGSIGDLAKGNGFAKGDALLASEEGAGRQDTLCGDANARSRLANVQRGAADGLVVGRLGQQETLEEVLGAVADDAGLGSRYLLLGAVDEERTSELEVGILGDGVNASAGVHARNVRVVDGWLQVLAGISDLDDQVEALGLRELRVAASRRRRRSARRGGDEANNGGKSCD